MGANVLHEDTIFPVLDLEIPINIRNTNKPDDDGTIITSKPKDASQIITGIAGKKDYESITIVKKAKTNKLEVMRKVLEVCSKYNVNVEHMPSSIDTFSLIVESKSIQKRIYEVIAEIKAIKEEAYAKAKPLKEKLDVTKKDELYRKSGIICKEEKDTLIEMIDMLQEAIVKEENTTKYDEFEEIYDEEVVCPYCGQKTYRTYIYGQELPVYDENLYIYGGPTIDFSKKYQCKICGQDFK